MLYISKKYFKKSMFNVMRIYSIFESFISGENIVEFYKMCYKIK